MKRTSLALLMLLGLARVSFAHEVVGTATPLMERMKAILLLLEDKKIAEAAAQASKAMNGFAVPGQETRQPGLKRTSHRLDRRFGTTVQETLTRSMREKDGEALKRSIQTLSLLLMFEKFSILESTFGKKKYSREHRTTLFWLGRNYFSYLLAPALARSDPIAEQALDRHLDKMLYRLEDGKWEEFTDLKQALVAKIAKAFNLSLSGVGTRKQFR